MAVRSRARAEALSVYHQSRNDSTSDLFGTIRQPSPLSSLMVNVPMASVYSGKKDPANAASYVSKPPALEGQTAMHAVQVTK
jgi:hypothetical protein